MDKKVILEYIKTHPGVSSRQIEEAMNGEVSLATVNRMVNDLINNFYVYAEGKARATRYYASALFAPVDLDEYYSKEVDEREVQTGYKEV